MEAKLRVPPVLAVAVFLGMLGLREPVEAACAAVGEGGLVWGETIGLLSNTYVPRQVIDDAVAYWSRCANYGFGFPSFVVGEEGTRTIYLEYHPSKVPGPCRGVGSASSC